MEVSYPEMRCFVRAFSRQRELFLPHYRNYASLSACLSLFLAHWLLCVREREREWHEASISSRLPETERERKAAAVLLVRHSLIQSVSSSMSLCVYVCLLVCHLEGLGCRATRFANCELWLLTLSVLFLSISLHRLANEPLCGA